MAEDPTDEPTRQRTKTAEIVPLRLPPVADDPAEMHDPRLGDVDEFGRSERVRALVRKVYDPVYRRWFRAEWEGFDKIPTEGGALLVANHAGAIPSDAPVIMHGIEAELERPVYGLADQFFKKTPVLGTMWARAGGVVAHPDNAYRILRERKELALVFPEGTKGTSKTFNERYRLARFGRGGFVEIAMRAGVPIIPIAVVGSEEAMPILFKVPSLAKAVGVPYFPITVNMALGPLGAAVPFPAKFNLRVLDPIHFDVEADQPRYSRSRIMDESERIRQQIQEALYDMLRRRRSVWTG
ncbi:MAG: acyltransferase family protein [Acidimicrobiales bacterium]|nr:acyltransferase family protein [Acidimicrobiales bacterium]